MASTSGGCDLTDTNLEDANLTNADLRATDLAGANLTGAILTDAMLADAVLPTPISLVTTFPPSTSPASVLVGSSVHRHCRRTGRSSAITSWDWTRTSPTLLSPLTT